MREICFELRLVHMKARPKREGGPFGQCTSPQVHVDGCDWEWDVQVLEEAENSWRNGDPIPDDKSSSPFSILPPLLYAFFSSKVTDNLKHEKTP